MASNNALDTPTAGKLLTSWNPTPTKHLRSVRLEEDIRDALQSVRLKQPTLAQRQHLLELSAQVGIQHAFLGFPAASAIEHERCLALTVHAAKHQLKVEPVFMARAVASDVHAILALREQSQTQVTADIFIGISDLRLQVEGWSRAQVMRKLEQACSLAYRENLRFRVSYEDASRATPAMLMPALQTAADSGSVAAILCDTVGDCIPAGAARLTEFAANSLQRINSTIDIGWHGHNDQGLAVANAWAAATSGAHIVSGTFVGFGERTGNTALEQIIWLLHSAGNDQYDLPAMLELCARISDYTGVEIPANAPLIGADAFSTSTGTHVAAILKARTLGLDYEDLVYSAVAATAIGRRQSLQIGPGSGRAALEYAIRSCGEEPSDELINTLSAHCHASRASLKGVPAITELLAKLKSTAMSSASPKSTP